MTSGFDYSKLDPETARHLQQTTKEIHELMENVGLACWSAGLSLIGPKVTVEQVANLLSKQWGHDKDFLITCMKRVDNPWKSQ